MTKNFLTPSVTSSPDQATSLVALSLSMETAEEPITLDGQSLEPHFPSLQHLLLSNAARDVPHLSAVARGFPNIRRVTLEPGIEIADHWLLDIGQILDIIIRGAVPEAADEQ